MPPDTSIEKRFLTRLKEEQNQCIDLLATPNDPTAFGYGKASGIIYGLRLAERVFEEVIGEEEDRT